MLTNHESTVTVDELHCEVMSALSMPSELMSITKSMFEGIGETDADCEAEQLGFSDGEALLDWQISFFFLTAMLRMYIFKFFELHTPNIRS